MPPKVKSGSGVARSRKKNVPKKADEISLTKSTPRKTRAKSRKVQKTPKNKCKIEPVASTSFANTSSASDEKGNSSKSDDLLITPKLMKYTLNAYKQSPVYDDLKNKRFNTSFSYETSRDCHKDMQIFPPEEDESPKWCENDPEFENKIHGAPGEKYADIFLSIPGIGISDSDEDEDENVVKSKKAKKKSVGKRGRKKSIGYNGLPLPDECLLTDYTSLLNSD